MKKLKCNIKIGLKKKIFRISSKINKNKGYKNCVKMWLSGDAISEKIPP